MTIISEPLCNEKNVIDFSHSKKKPYFYMFLDFGTFYLCLRSNRRTYDLDIVRQVPKDEVDPKVAELLLEEGREFFKHTDKVVEGYLKQFGIEFD